MSWVRLTSARFHIRLTTDAAAEIKRLQKEVAELRKANENLRAASIFFAKELDHPSTR
ncbi:hypothetical protein [Microbacterium lacticum]